MPTTRGRNQLEQASGTIPRRANTKPIFATSAASRTSIGRVIVIPTPTAGPLIAATTGFVDSKMRRLTRPPVSRGTRPPSSCRSRQSKVPAPPPRSAPAQKPRPAPVTITARTASSASAASKAAISSRAIVTVNAFSRSGRSSVIVATCPSSS
ncbi:MAG TPA: hypothetical protein VFB44_01770 [Thermoleophilaceae bacterium]|nr:hypothetical protein [Thermoleophilaceae bacterium]